ncbi:MAG: rod shape-determining protein MreC [Acidimicrobiales bacterium]
MVSDRSKRRAWTLGVTALVVVTALYLTVGVLSGLRRAANLVVAPFAWTVDEVSLPIGHLLAGAINYSDVVAQNQRLRYELGRAQLRAEESWALERQLTQLTTELHVPFVGTLATVAAQVTTFSPSNFAATFDISAGQDQGVLVGMPVVANGGLVGVVVSTTPGGATVRMISDGNSVVGVTFGNAHNSFVLAGTGLGNSLVTNSAVLSVPPRPGQLLSTDGLNGGLFPPGLPVARVTNVSGSTGAGTVSVRAQPVADLAHLFYVDVVLWEPST